MPDESTNSAQSVSRLHAWLSPADLPRPADLLFILAGRVHRKEYALELSRQGLAPQLLFSVGRFEIRRFSKMDLPVSLDLLKLAQELPPPQRHYFVLFNRSAVQVEHVPPVRFGTLTEIEALARWLETHPEIRSILVISSAAHLRRIRMCCRALLSPKMEVTFLASPSSLPQSGGGANPSQSAAASKPGDAPDTGSMATDLQELLKLFVYWILLKFR
jgi:uncharacterized SAM-binding protein YcdF (DUF218 family)